MPTAIDDLMAGKPVRAFPFRSDSGNAVTVATSGTILHNGQRIIFLTNGGAVTSVVLQKGTDDSQPITLVNTTANAITFATDATSNVLDGTNIAIAAKRACDLYWSAVLGLWVAVKSA